MGDKVDSHASGTLSELDMAVVRAVPAGGNWRNLPHDFPSQRVQQIRHGASNGGGSRSTYYGRLRRDRPAYTINTFITRPGNGCFIHPVADRLITAREAARLQSFPDSTKFFGSLRSRAVQIGNAVPPLLAYQVARTIPAGAVVDLFCGAGGLSLGFEWAGHTLVAAADSDRYATEAAAANAAEGGSVERLDLADDDVLKALARRALKRAGGAIGTLVGGPPCQGFSTAGPCRIADERNHLVRTFLDAVRLMEPETVLMENVPALMWRGSAFLEELTEQLALLGYTTSVVLLHAEAYGVPQLRRRLLIKAVANADPTWPAPTHQLSDPCYPSHQPSAREGVLPITTVGDAISDLPLEVGHDVDDLVALADEASAYQQWSRGSLSLESLLPTTVLAQSARHSQPMLFAPEAGDGAGL